MLEIQLGCIVPEYVTFILFHAHGAFSFTYSDFETMCSQNINVMYDIESLDEYLFYDKAVFPVCKNI